jgi:hypothetical protein
VRTRLTAVTADELNLLNAVYGELGTEKNPIIAPVFRSSLLATTVITAVKKTVSPKT